MRKNFTYRYKTIWPVFDMFFFKKVQFQRSVTYKLWSNFKTTKFVPDLNDGVIVA